MHDRGVKMAMISKQNESRRQYICLQGHFVLRSQPFWRPLGFDQICPGFRQRTLNYIYNPAALFLTLNKFASNLDRAFNRS
jgi:hypothetical protein